MGREYIAGNQASAVRMKSLIERMSDEDLKRTFDWGWTVSVALVHVAFFDRRAARLIERWEKEGYGPSPYDAHAINDAMLPAWLLIPPRDAVAEAIAAAAEADAAVARVPDELLKQIQAGSVISVNRATHRTMHLDEIEALLG
jgi:hypothetical protein